MVLVIFNPHAGKSRARRRLPGWLTKHAAVELQATEGPGHAEELALAAAESGTNVVAAAGGDGTVHEVANGLLRSGRTDVTLAVVPIGSANDFAYSVERQFGTSSLVDGIAHPVDVGRVDADNRSRFFVESVGVGLSARVTLESRKIQRLQGLLLYGLAALRALSAHKPQPLTLGWDGETPVDQMTLMLTLMLGLREGNFVLAPQASLDDGLFDAVHALDLGRWSAMWMLPRLIKSGPPENHPRVKLRRCRELTISVPTPLTIHADGEMFCTPEDNLTSASVTLLPRRLLAKVCAS